MGDGVSPAGFAVQGGCSAAAEHGRFGQKEQWGQVLLRGTRSHTALGKQMHLVVPQCSVDPCSWTKKAVPVFKEISKL